MIFILFIIGVMLIGGGILSLAKPDLGWENQRWKFKNFDAEPSEAYISYKKFLGVLFIVAGALCWIFSVLTLLQDIHSS